MKTTLLSALEIAALRFYGTAAFDTDHHAAAHPGMLASLVRRGLLRHCLGSYDTTPAGEKALKDERMDGFGGVPTFPVPSFATAYRVEPAMRGKFRVRLFWPMAFGLGQATWTYGVRSTDLTFRSAEAAGVALVASASKGAFVPAAIIAALEAQ